MRKGAMIGIVTLLIAATVGAKQLSLLFDGKTLEGWEGNLDFFRVEDEAIVAMDIQNCLKNMGYAVTNVTSTGEQAIDKAAMTRPDLVLMDINLAGDMDGIAAAKEIRRRFNIPVIFLTSYADEDTLRRAKATEQSGYILKPFDDAELRAVVERAIQKHKTEIARRVVERKHAAKDPERLG